MNPFRPEMTKLLTPLVERLRLAAHPERADEFESVMSEMEERVSLLFTEYANDFATTLGVFLSFHGTNEVGQSGESPAAAVVSMATNASRILADILRQALTQAEEDMSHSVLPDIAAMLIQIQDLDGWEETTGSGTLSPPQWDA